MKKMKTITGYLILVALPLILLFGCGKSLQNLSQQSSAVTTTATTTTAFSTLVWSDEFDGTAVNTSNWGYDIGGSGWGNNEKEYYQAANATVANGNLVITAKEERVKSNPYTSVQDYLCDDFFQQETP